MEACTSTTLVANLGKPHPVMLYAALTGLDVEIPDCVMVGDRPATDIQMGIDTGMVSVLVTTGENTREDVQGLPEPGRPTTGPHRPAAAPEGLGGTRLERGRFVTAGSTRESK